MRLAVVDANQNTVTVIVQSNGASLDSSDAITSTGVSQEAAPVNADREGCFFQNKSAHAMTLNDLGDATEDSAFLVAAGASWPPDGYPIPLTAITVAGTALDKFLYREW